MSKFESCDWSSKLLKVSSIFMDGFIVLRYTLVGIKFCSICLKFLSRSWRKWKSKFRIYFGISKKNLTKIMCRLQQNNPSSLIAQVNPIKMKQPADAVHELANWSPLTLNSIKCSIKKTAILLLPFTFQFVPFKTRLLQIRPTTMKHKSLNTKSNYFNLPRKELNHLVIINKTSYLISFLNLLFIP